MANNTFCGWGVTNNQTTMLLTNIIVVLIVVGVLMFLLNKAPVIDAQYKAIINWVVLVLVVLWILGAFIPALHLGGRLY